MPETQLLDFMDACLKEVDSRLGVKMSLPDVEGVKTDPDFKDKSVAPEDFRRAAQALKRFGSPDKQALFDAEVVEVSPARFVDLLAACDAREGISKEHVSSCVVCQSRIAYFTTVFFAVLAGGKVEDVRKVAPGDLLTALADACVEGIISAAPYINWVELMFEPAYLGYAARAVEGLSPEQGKAVLTTAFTVVNNLPKRPDPDRFKDIMRNTRQLVELGFR